MGICSAVPATSSSHQASLHGLATKSCCTACGRFSITSASASASASGVLHPGFQGSYQLAVRSCATTDPGLGTLPRSSLFLIRDSPTDTSTAALGALVTTASTTLERPMLLGWPVSSRVRDDADCARLRNRSDCSLLPRSHSLQEPPSSTRLAHEPPRIPSRRQSPSINEYMPLQRSEHPHVAAAARRPQLSSSTPNSASLSLF